MSVALTEPDRYFSREEYRRWCEEQLSGRYERVDGRIVAMAPERVAHVRVKSAVWLALRRAVVDAGVACEALSDGVTIETGENDFEPDALVNCGPRVAGDAVAAPNPVVVVEVLSPGTRSVDSQLKLVGYFAAPSISHYLIIHPVKRMIIHHRRSAGRIDTHILSSGAIVMDPPGITITVDEIYEAA